MRINELIVESQQIDEISLAGIGKGIGKAANVAGKAVGGAVGGTVAAAKQFGSGVKQGYQGASNAVGGVQTPSTAPTGTTSAPTGSAPVATNAPQTTPSSTAPAGTTQQPATPASNTTQLKAPPVVPGNLDGIKKAYSILDPNEKEQLKKDLEVIDDQDRLATGTNESRRVGMKSNFLGIDL
jgi:hypothetical protein